MSESVMYRVSLSNDRAVLTLLMSSDVHAVLGVLAVLRVVGGCSGVCCASAPPARSSTVGVACMVCGVSGPLGSRRCVGVWFGLVWYA